MSDTTPADGKAGRDESNGNGSDERVGRRRVLAALTGAVPLAGLADPAAAQDLNRIVVRANRETVRYRFSVTNEVRKGPEADADDYILQGVVAGGRVRRYGVDDYRYRGRINSFLADGPVRIYVNGNRIYNPRERFNDRTTRLDDGGGGGIRDRRLSTRISIRGETGRPADYTFVVSGRVEADGSVDYDDEFAGARTVRGTVAGGVDHYRYSGALTFFDSRGGPVRVTIRTSPTP